MPTAKIIVEIEGGDVTNVQSTVNADVLVVNRDLIDSTTPAYRQDYEGAPAQMGFFTAEATPSVHEMYKKAVESGIDVCDCEDETE